MGWPAPVSAPVNALGMHVARSPGAAVQHEAGLHADLAAAVRTKPARRVQPMSFPEHERRHLLAQPGVGLRVVQRLEQAGYHSLAAIRQTGVKLVVSKVSATLGSTAWANRTRALERAIRSKHVG